MPGCEKGDRSVLEQPMLDLRLRNIFALAAALLLLAGCGPTLEYRYRIKIEIDTPKGIVSSANVVETHWTVQSGWWVPPDARGARRGNIGDAVFVDLGEGKHVVALLVLGATATEYGAFSEIVPRALGLLQVDVKTLRARVEDALERKAVFEVPREVLPKLATFRDLNDPWSARILNPNTDDFAQAFGPGYRFRRATIQIVPKGVWPLNVLGIWGEPLSRVIDDRLPFLTTRREEMRNILDNLPLRFFPHYHYFRSTSRILD
jgi:hypothetical protein